MLYGSRAILRLVKMLTATGLRLALKHTLIQTPNWQVIDVHLVPVMIADRIEKGLVAVII